MHQQQQGYLSSLPHAAPPRPSGHSTLPCSPALLCCTPPGPGAKAATGGRVLLAMPHLVEWRVYPFILSGDLLPPGPAAAAGRAQLIPGSPLAHSWPAQHCPPQHRHHSWPAQRASPTDATTGAHTHHPHPKAACHAPRTRSCPRTPASSAAHHGCPLQKHRRINCQAAGRRICRVPPRLPDCHVAAYSCSIP